MLGIRLRSPLVALVLASLAGCAESVRDPVSPVENTDGPRTSTSSDVVSIAYLDAAFGVGLAFRWCAGHWR